MAALGSILLTQAADASAAGQTMRSFVTPVFTVMCALASLVAVFYLATGGIAYMTSTGQPDKLDHAKRVIRNALLGLVIVLAAGTITAILNHAYQAAPGAGLEKFPTLTSVQPAPVSSGLVDVLIKAITGLFEHIIQSAASPFINALAFFTRSTPLMATNPSVFNLWLAVVGIADALFVLVVALLGFHIMSYASFGLEEIEFKHLLPQLALAFLLMNVSIFAIDGIISLSNAMIHALYSAFPSVTVWQALSNVAKQSAGLGLVALMIFIVFVIFAVILLIYYVTRLVTLYIGAVASPLLVLFWLLPGFRDFVAAAVKTYLTTIFVLFVHVMILLLAASIFAGMTASSSGQSLDPVMSTVVGTATLLALLKTQGVLMQLSYVSIGPKAMRRLGSQFVNGISYTTNKIKTVRAAR